MHSPHDAALEIATGAKRKKKAPAKPNPKAPVGEGGRFAALKQKLGKKS